MKKLQNLIVVMLLTSFTAIFTQGLTDIQVAALTPVQLRPIIQRLSAAQMSVLSKDQIFDGAIIGFLISEEGKLKAQLLTLNQLSQFNPSQIQGVIKNLSQNQISWLSNRQLLENAKNKNTISFLSADQVKALTENQLKPFNASQIRQILVNLSENQISWLSNHQLLENVDNKNNISLLSAEQVKALTKNQLRSFNASQVAQISANFSDKQKCYVSNWNSPRVCNAPGQWNDDGSKKKI